MKTICQVCICWLVLVLSAQGLASEAEAIWQSQQQGGLVVLVRHAAVDREQGRRDPLLRDAYCHGELNLSEQGRLDAAQLGSLFVSRDIPIAQVLTSPYCRARDTASIAFGRAESVEYLSLLEALPQAQAVTHTQQLLDRIGSFQGKGNLLLVTHEPNILAVSFETVEMGNFPVFRPKGGEAFEALGKIVVE